MMVRQFSGVFAVALALAGCATTPPPKAAALAPAEAERVRQLGAQVLFWSQEQRDANFPAMEKLFPGNVVRAGGKARALPVGKPLAIADAEIEAYMASANTAGVVVLKDGKIVLERYARGFGRNGRYTSFSVAKSFTSTLVGAAIADGYIKSVNDPVTRYIPALAGSAYDGVSIKQLLTMTSGVKWNEDYTDPQSDVARMYASPAPPGVDPTVAYMRMLPRDAEPGSKWVYKTGETNLIGVLVREATGKSLASYLSDKIWRRYAMEQDAFWMVDAAGGEIGGCCMSVALRDYARMGQLALDGGKGIVPEGWFAEATRASAQIGVPGYGYGYQWWTYPGNRFGAQGIFGQSITIDRDSRTVVAMVSAWPRATGSDLSIARAQFIQKLIAAAR